AIGRECPPAPMKPVPPPLFRPNGIRSRCSSMTVVVEAQAWLLTYRCDLTAGPAGLRGEIKEEAFAAGGSRGTFARKVCRSRPAREPSVESDEEPFASRQRVGVLPVRRLVVLQE